MYLFLANNQITISKTLKLKIILLFQLRVFFISAQLWRFLCGFSEQKIGADKLYSYIQQAYFDSKKQPKIKKFFNVSFKKRDNIGPSSSSSLSSLSSNTSTKKTDNERKSKETVDEKCKEEALESVSDLFEEDIIPGTPPEELIKFKKKTPKTKSKLTPEEIAQKMPKTNIIELIDILDGNANTKPLETVKEETFLTQIDKLSKKLNSELSQEGSEEGENMEVDPVEEKKYSDTEMKNVSCNENKSTKRKISDYFQKPFKSS